MSIIATKEKKKKINHSNGEQIENGKNITKALKIIVKSLILGFHSQNTIV